MAWRTQKPEAITDLKGAPAWCRTDACRFGLAGYAELLAAAGGAIPAKNDLDLRCFAGTIPNLVLFAISKPDRCIYRLAGEDVKRRLGMNPAGRNYCDFAPPARRASVVHSFNMVIDVPCGFRAAVHQTYDSGLTALVEAVALPLRSDEPGVDGFVLIVDQYLQWDSRLAPVKHVLLGTNVPSRVLIDLGWGVDASFVDVVPA